MGTAMETASRKKPARSQAERSAFRRRQIIAATIDSIGKIGFAETTLATVAKEAGVSQGILVFHFKTKDALLEETLRYLADEYRALWSRALSAADEGPAERLRAMLLADFDPPVFTRKKVAVWHAFFGEAKARPKYLEIYGVLDRAHWEAVAGLCRELLAGERGAADEDEAAAIAYGLCALSDGLWLNFLLTPRGFGRKQARHIMLRQLRAYFPDRYEDDARTVA
ncbi:MAG: transcriptional regulator BetI [Rhodospirillales bacterium]|nr:transcriptional regulator BetI [Rhodospirillales bacterium]MDH3966315.1 transcriptional regulator BetI [Rhodospirillales bacterium]